VEAAGALSARVEVFGLDGVPDWVEMDDVSVDEVLRHEHGIKGTGPTDVLAGSGELTLSANNGPDNESGTRGRYAIGHPSAAEGFTDGAPMRVVYTYQGIDYVAWTGKLADSDPEAEYDGLPLAHITAYDYATDLVDANVVEITPQRTQSESALFSVLLDAIPADAQPPSRNIASAFDVYPYALYKLGAKTKCATAIKDVLISGLGLGGNTCTGAWRYINRSIRFTSPPIGSLDDTMLVALGAPSRRSERSNCVQCVYHPPRVDAAPVVLFAQVDKAFYIGPGEVFEDFTPYRDPSQIATLIGAVDFVAVAAGTDWVANEQEDGSGLNITGSVTATRDDFATRAKWRFDNSANAFGVWITSRQVRGYGIYDDDEPYVESSTVQPYGKKPMTVDLPYQGDCRVASGIAELIRSQQETVGPKAGYVQFLANDSSDLMKMALGAEFGDKIELTNAQTGLVTQVMEIRRIAHELHPGNLLYVRWDLALTSDLTVVPVEPSALVVSIASDTELLVQWTTGDATAQTEVLVDGVVRATVAAGSTAVIVNGLTRATDYDITVRHMKYALIRSSEVGPVTGRPHVVATGGTIVDSLGLRYHSFYASDTLAISKRGRVSYVIAGAGGGAGGSSALFISSGGGGGGNVVLATDNDEPVGSYAVVIGAGGAGAVVNGATTGGEGSDSTYRGETAKGGGGGGSHVFGFPHDGTGRGTGGGGAGEGGTGGIGDGGGNGGNGGIPGSGYRTGGGGGGAGGNGGNGVEGGSGSAVGGAGGVGVFVPVITDTYGTGGRGGGPGGALGADAAWYGDGGAGNLNGDGGDGFQGIAHFWYPI
jgi:hypothetical protein